MLPLALVSLILFGSSQSLLVSESQLSFDFRSRSFGCRRRDQDRGGRGGGGRAVHCELAGGVSGQAAVLLPGGGLRAGAEAGPRGPA